MHHTTTFSAICKYPDRNFIQKIRTPCFFQKVRIVLRSCFKKGAPYGAYSQGSRKDFASAKDLWKKGEQVLSWQSHSVALTTCELGNGALFAPFPDRARFPPREKHWRKRKQLEQAQAVQNAPCGDVVEITRLELVTYTLRTYRATNCAISPKL